MLSPQVALAGKTNAGKSSLFNRLLNENRSIVSSTHGTTRDFVSEYISFDGVSYRLVDTAGVRDTDCDIESAGILRAKDEFSKSFFKVLVINPGEDLPSKDEIFNSESVDLIIFTHADCSEKKGLKKLLKSLPEASYAISLSLAKEGSGSIEPVLISGPTGANDLGPMGPLEVFGPMGAMARLVSEKYGLISENNPIIVPRHRETIKDIYEICEELRNLLFNTLDFGIISSEIMIIDTKIQELIGVFSPDDVLNNIFSNFCIGK